MVNGNMLLTRIKDDLKKAMQAKNKELAEVLRMLISALRNKEISLRKGDNVELSDEQIIEVVASEIKKRKDSIEAYSKAERVDLVKKEEEEIKILEKYLPKQLSEEEIEKIIKEVISSLGEVSPKDFGRIMGMIMPKLKGKADGAKVQEIVRKIISG